MLTANHGYRITQQLSRSQDEVGRWFESANKQLSVVSFDPYAYVSNFLLLKPTEKYRCFIWMCINREHRDIQYQRVKIYILILSHLGGFNKRVSVAQVFFYYEADGLERQTFWSLFLRQKIAGNSHNNRRGLKAVCVSVELEQKMIVRGHRGRVVDLYGLGRCLQWFSRKIESAWLKR